jgi:hypothetical protein
MMTFDEFRRLYTSPDVSRCLATHSAAHNTASDCPDGVSSGDKLERPGSSGGAQPGLTKEVPLALPQFTHPAPTTEQLWARITLALSVISHRCEDPTLAATLTDVLNGKTIEDFLATGRVA